MADWSGADYARVSALQRSVATETLAGLVLDGDESILDIGCGDGFLTRGIAARVPRGLVVGIDPSPQMVATAAAGAPPGTGGPYFVRADALRLPCRAAFDLAVSFNALHWVPELGGALAQIALVLRPGGRAVIQMVCAGPRRSIEATAMQIARSPRWSAHFGGFVAPFVHVDPAAFAELAGLSGLRLHTLTVRDRKWDFGSRQGLTAWCGVGVTAWTNRLAGRDRAAFVDDLVSAYEPVAGAAGLFRFMQLRAELRG